MTDIIVLSKKVEIVLEKRGISNIIAQVGFASDVSPSMKHFYLDGTMQEILSRIQAVAMKFDDNQSLDNWIFDNTAYELPATTPANFSDYIQRHVMSRKDIWNGTNFAPVLRSVRDHYFVNIPASAAEVKEAAKGLLAKAVSFFGSKEKEEEKPTSTKSETADHPVYLMFQTDGDNFDEEETEAFIKELEWHHIYIQFIGVGTTAKFEFVKRMAQKYGHVGFVHFKELDKVTDEQLYETLINTEFSIWLKNQVGK